MPSGRSRPARPNPSPRRSRGASRSGGSRRGSSRAPYWIAGILILVLLALAIGWWEMPRIQDYLAGRESRHLPEEPLPGEAPETPPHHPTAAELAKERRARARAEAEAKRHQEAQTAPPEAVPREAPPPVTTMAPPAANPPTAPSAPPVTTAPTPQPVPVPPATTATEPPIVQPVPLSPAGSPARALPLDPNKLDTERIAAYQVALERIHFSCGFVDGNQGMRTQRMLRAFQQSRGLPITGFLDPATRAAIGEPGEPFLTYTVTATDVGSIMPKPDSWRAKAKAKRLGYNDIWELLAEKFHCTRGYLKALNPGVLEPVAGTELIGPKVYPAAPIPKAASLRVLLSETSIEALDAQGRTVAFFPCSIAKDKNKRPNGKLVVKSVVPDPDYTFDPALFADAAKNEGLTHKMVLPPGPRNPVGTAWIGLSLPGYGIHGTPEPENISRTQSHGCFRLANWNANKVLDMVRVGTPVDVQP